jgi:hypothetical protein
MRWLLMLLLLVGPALRPAAAGPLQILQRLAAHRGQTCLIGSCRTVHASLLGVPLRLPESKVLSHDAARAKTYASSWTCRESSRLLIEKLAASGQKLELDSSGKNAFQWGNEGFVSFHYYAVDSTSQPRLLVDPTASSNFAMDVQPGGLMRQYLDEAGRTLGTPRAAKQVLRRMLASRSGDLLILDRPAEIAVYRDALERAASRQRAMTRDVQRSDR